MHFHCYAWSGSGPEAERTLPRIVTDWMGKRELLRATQSEPEAALEWLLGEWEKASSNAMYPTPEAWGGWEYPRREMFLQQLRGGTYATWAVVGTGLACH